MPIVTDRIYAGLIENERVSKASYVRKTHSLTASTISVSGCRRANWYAIKNVKPDRTFEPDPVLLSKFWDGKKAHAALGALFYDCKIKILGREIVTDCKGIYVRIDYRIEIDGITYNLEFKTMIEGSFNNFVKFGIVSFPGYYAQCQVMSGSNPLLPSIVLAKCKGSSDYWDELITPDWDFIDSLVDVKGDFDVAIESGTKPPRGFDYHSQACKSCEFRVKCWFYKLRKDTVLERDLNPRETSVINHLYKIIQDSGAAFDIFVEAEKELKNYIAFVHTEHGVSGIKLDGINSTWVTSHPQSYDMDYIRSILTEEQLKKAIKHGTNNYFRTTIR